MGRASLPDGVARENGKRALRGQAAACTLALVSPRSSVRLVSGGFAGLLTIFALAGSFATAATTAACGNTEERCDTSLSGCDNSAVYKRNLDVTSEDIPTLNIVFCVDTTCWTLTPVENADGSYTCTSSPDGATCGITQDETSGYDLSITTTGSLDVSSGSGTFTVNVTVAGSNTPIVMLSKVELYTPVYLNGTDCPASCEVATLQ